MRKVYFLLFRIQILKYLPKGVRIKSIIYIYIGNKVKKNKLPVPNTVNWKYSSRFLALAHNVG